MIIVSLNMRGLGGRPKQLALHKLIDMLQLDLVLLQETMMNGDKARDLSAQFLAGWEMCSIDSNGQSGGLLSNFVPFMTYGGILLEGVIKDLCHPLNILNCYGPYHNRLGF